MNISINTNVTNEQQTSLNIVFQPIVDLSTGGFFGHEAFSRPSSIFHIRNKKKLLAVDLQALALAMDKAQLLLPQGKIFINVRPSTLVWLYKNDQKIYLPETNGLVLELTEGEQDGSIYYVKQAIKWIKGNLGCQFAIDDISSGFNRLRYVYELDPDYLKIDRPLIQNCHDSIKKQKVIKGIQDLAKTLKVELIAEGIEKEGEKETLVQLGVHYGQGYLFGKPSTDGR